MTTSDNAMNIGRDNIIPNNGGLNFATVNITPDLAEKWLTLNTNNRTINWSTVTSYANQMLRGEWVLNGETIIWGENNVLQNGQHRLLACIQSGCSFQSAVIFGTIERAYDVMDGGKNRTMSNILTHHGVSNSTRVGVISKIVLAYDKGIIHKPNRITEQVSRFDILQFEKENSSLLQEASRISARAGRSGMNPGAAGAMYYLIQRASGIEVASDWMGDAVDGLNLGPGDPRLALRRWSIAADNGKFSIHLSAWIRTRNAAFEGRPLSRIFAWTKGDGYPTLIEDDHRLEALGLVRSGMAPPVPVS